jgi:hypothetical protein
MEVCRVRIGRGKWSRRRKPAPASVCLLFTVGTVGMWKLSLLPRLTCVCLECATCKYGFMVWFWIKCSLKAFRILFLSPGSLLDVRSWLFVQAWETITVSSRHIAVMNFIRNYIQYSSFKGRLQWPHGLRSLERRDCGFEIHPRQCLYCVRLFCCSVYRQRPSDGLIPRQRGPTDCV